MDFAGEISYRDSVISFSFDNTLPFRQMLFSLVLSFHIWSAAFGQYLFEYTHIHVLFPCCTHFHEIFLHQWYVILYECKGLQRFNHFLSFSFYSLLKYMNYEYYTCLRELRSFMNAWGCDDLVIFIVLLCSLLYVMN